MAAIGFTGRRPNRLGGYGRTSNPYYKWVVEQIGDVLGRAYEVGYRRFISGMALGFDWWVAEEVLAWQQDRATSDVVLLAAVPHENQDARWNSHDRERYEDMLRQAEVHLVSEGGYEPGKLWARNKWIADNSSYLVACWEHKPEGGTWNTISYARQQKKMVYVINYETRKCEWIR